MSKKRRERASESEHIELGLTASTGNRIAEEQTIDSSQSNQPNQSNQSTATRLLVYVRNPSHWWVIGLIALFTLGAMGAGLKYLEEAAQKERVGNNLSANSRQNKSFLSSINPFAASPVVTPTPALSKEYIYAGSRMLAVVDDGADAEPPADLAYWRPSTGTWYVMGGTGSQQVTVTWGTSGNTPVPGDYDGDGKTDFAVYAPGATATWNIQKSSDNTQQISYSLGTTGDKLAQADYDGDGKTDAAVFNPATLAWQIRQSSTGTTVTATLPSSFVLQSGDTPAPADYDGDGKADITVWRGNTFYTLRSSDNVQPQPTALGTSGDVPVCGDYDGDGRADYAVKSGNNWIIRYSSTGVTQTPIPWYLSTDTPVPNDYDGDGKVDVAVWRSTARGTWYIKNSSNGATRMVYWGRAGDVPVPAFYRR